MGFFSNPNPNFVVYNSRHQLELIGDCCDFGAAVPQVSDGGIKL